MNLEVGCSIPEGYKRRDKNWVNLDLIRHRGVNVIGDGILLPFLDDTFEVVHCIHVIEHLTRDRITPIIKELCRVTKKQCLIEVPDFKKTVALLYNAFEIGDEHAQHIWRTSIYGRTERRGMAHHFGFDEVLLKKIMQDAGFNSVTRLTKRDKMISTHFKQEPIILMEGKK